MTRIVHLTDLHFGYEHAGMVASLLNCVNAQRADLVVVTGDLTHRARPSQFASASEFLAGIEAPKLVVPGNHDIPLYDVVSRFLWPWSGYRRWVCRQLAPFARINSVQVTGINSVDPFSWRRGILRPGMLDAAVRRLDRAATNIIAVHHPLQHRPDETKGLARNAETALTRLENAGVQVVLSGHLHAWTAESLLLAGPHHHVLQVQSGTALCARPGEPPNEFTVLDFGEESSLTITRYRAVDETYDPGIIAGKTTFSRASGHWRILD